MILPSKIRQRVYAKNQSISKIDIWNAVSIVKVMEIEIVWKYPKD